jgi:hypothetical protein
VRKFGAERKRGATPPYLLLRACDHVLGGDEPDIAALRYSTLERDLKIDDLDLVLDERPAGFAVLAAPSSSPAKTVALAQQTCAAVGECVDHWGRAGSGEAVELGARAIDVTGVEEQVEAVVGAVERTADKRCNVRRPDEPMLRHLAHDLHVIIRETEGWWLWSSAESRQSSWFLGNTHTR